MAASHAPAIVSLASIAPRIALNILTFVLNVTEIRGLPVARSMSGSSRFCQSSRRREPAASCPETRFLTILLTSAKWSALAQDGIVGNAVAGKRFRDAMRVFAGKRRVCLTPGHMRQLGLADDLLEFLSQAMRELLPVALWAPRDVHRAFSRAKQTSPGQSALGFRASPWGPFTCFFAAWRFEQYCKKLVNSRLCDCKSASTQVRARTHALLRFVSQAGQHSRSPARGVTT